MPLPIPSKLYGRDSAKLEFVNCFSLVKDEGKPRALLVSGSPGVGKTAVISQGERIIAEQGKCFIAAGKCDRLQYNIPYVALIAALRKLIRRILDQSSKDGQIAKLRTALGINGQVIIDVIPEVELLIGKQPSVPTLGTVENQNRFNLVFGNFIRSFCSQDEPLVLFLDDLQWADPATLNLMQLLLTDPETQYLFFVGAYRSNEVSPDHPLAQAIESLQAAGTNIQQLQLQSLSERHVSQLVVDTLQERSERSRAFASLMFRLTAGNPLVLKQSFYSLYLNKQLFQDTRSGTWNWQIEQLPKQELFEIVAQRLAQLPPQANHLLKRVACVGGRMSSQLLAVVGEQSTFKTLLQLRPALRVGLIVIKRKSSELMVCFVHDRIQQVVYDSIEPVTKTAMHLATGQLLQTGNNTDHFFSMVSQFNLGARLITSQTKRDELCVLNLKASQKAKDCADFASALTYVNKCMDLLGHSWERSYSLTLKVYQKAIEVEYLNGNFERSHILSNTALENTETLLEEIGIYQLKIQAYIAQSLYREAVELGFSVLRSAGVNLTENLPDNLTLEVLENLPKASDKLKIFVLRILCTIGDFAPFVDTECIPAIIITELSLYWQMGNSVFSASVCIDYAFLLSASGNTGLGNQYGELALRLLDRFDLKRLNCKVINIYNCGVKHWTNLRETLGSLKNAIKSGIEYGDLEFTGHTVLNLCTHSVFAGVNLEETEKTYEEYTKILEKFRLYFHIQINKIFNQLVLILRENSKENIQFKGGIFDAEQSLSAFHEENNTFALFLTYLAQGILLYLAGNYTQAVASFNAATEYAAVMSGFAAPTQLNFYQSLAILGHYHSAPLSERPALLETVRANQRQIAAWSRSGPMNFLHKFQLVEAERARIFRDYKQAESLYLKAIRGAARQGFIHEEALANELLGCHYLERGQTDLGKTKIIRARELYVIWGAIRKVQLLEKEHPSLQPLEAASLDSRQAVLSYYLSKQYPDICQLLQMADLVFDFDNDTKVIQVLCRNNFLAGAIRSQLKKIKHHLDITLVVVVKQSH